MEVSRIGILLAFCFMIQVSYQQSQPGMRMEITPSGILQIEKVAEPLLEQYLASIEPVSIPDFEKDEIDLEFKLTNLEMGNIQWDSFDLQILQGKGFQVQLQGLQSSLLYTMWLSMTFPSINDSWSGNATLNHTNVVFEVDIGSAGGLVTVQISNMIVSIGSLDLDLPDYIEQVIQADWINSIVRRALDDILPGEIQPQANSFLVTFLQSLPMQMFLDPKNFTIFDYSLFSAPVFDVKSGISVSFNGDIYDTRKHDSCPLTPQPIPSIDDQYNVRFYVSESVLNCALLAFKEAKILKDQAKQYISSLLHLDGRIGFGLDFPTPSYATVNVDTISLLIRSQVYFDQNVPAVARFIDIPVNLSADAQLWIDTQHGDDYIKGSINNTDVTLEVSYFNQDLMPPEYAQEIQNTNFTELASQANAFITQNVLPAANQKLAQGYPLPDSIAQYLYRPEISLQDGFIFVGFGISKYPGSTAKHLSENFLSNPSDDKP